MLRILNGCEYSLTNIIDFMQEEGSVIRTAHVGNFDKTTLFLASKGIPICLGENIKGYAGLHFRPGFLCHSSEKTRISRNTQILIAHDSSILSDRISESIKLFLEVKKNNIKSPGQLHWRVLHKLYPNTRLASDFFLNQGYFTFKIIEAMATYFPFVFSTYAMTSGKTLTIDKKRSNDKYLYYSDGSVTETIRKNEIANLAYQYLVQVRARLNDDDAPPISSGLIIHPVARTVLLTILEVFKGRKGQQRYQKDLVSVIHIAGLRMMSYLLEDKHQASFNTKEMGKIYNKLYRLFSDSLPKNIDFYLTPSTPLGRFVTKDKKLCKYYSEVIDNGKVHFLRDEIGGYSYDKNESITQYDLIKNKIVLYFPKCAEVYSQNKLNSLMKAYS